MSYKYAEQKDAIFEPCNQEKFLKIRDNTKHLLETSGCFMMGCVFNGVGGDAWFMMACVDRLVELGELKEVTYGDCAGQHRIFRSG